MADKKRRSKIRVWSANSKYFHTKGCPAVGRIAKTNLESGPAPSDKVPHSCVDTSYHENNGAGNIAAAAKADEHLTEHRIPHQPNHKVSTQSLSLNTSSPLQQGASGQALHSKTLSKPATKPKSLNPYCQCDPCECNPPCTCGLQKRESTAHTAWDADNHILTHTTKDIYRPESRNNTSVPAPTQPVDKYPEQLTHAQETPVASAEDALGQLTSVNAKHQRFVDKYQLADAFAEHHGTHAVSVRTSEHKGYNIEIRTHYEITIDGQPFDVHIQVSPDGKVHCHSIPNYESSSTVDLIRAIVDTFRDDFPPKH